MTLFFFSWPKSGIIGILWFSTAGASIAGSGFVGSCSRYDTSGTCSAGCAVTQLICPHATFLQKKGSHVVLGCHVSSATAIFGLINGTLCKSPAPKDI